MQSFVSIHYFSWSFLPLSELLIKQQESHVNWLRVDARWKNLTILKCIYICLKSVWWMEWVRIIENWVKKSEKCFLFQFHSINSSDGLLFCKIKFYSYKILIAFVSVSGFYANSILLDFRFLLGSERNISAEEFEFI